MNRSVITYKITNEDNEKNLGEILKRKIGLSSRFIRKLKDDKGIKLNKKVRYMDYIVKTDDILTIAFPIESHEFEPQNIPIDVVYEDEHLLVINKASFIVVHPTKGHHDRTIANAVAYYMNEKKEQYKPRFVNRLDRDTTGLIIIGKNAFVQEEIVKQMKDNQMKKKYIAITKGVIENDEGTINEPIGMMPDSTICRGVVEGGKPSVTHYKVLKRIDTKYTVVEVALETGRTHQIRVHMSHIGHSLLSDFLYGDEDEVINRQALHAYYLSFIHPVTKKPIVLQAKVPDDMGKIIGDSMAL